MPAILIDAPYTVRWMIPFTRKELSYIFTAIFQSAGYPVADIVLEVSFMDDREMATLNMTALGCSGPTNVLSFPSSQIPCPSSSTTQGSKNCTIPLGLLAISPATVLRECLLYGQDSESHFIRLFSHGAAHLLGYDHGPIMDTLCLSFEKAAKQALV